MKKWVQYQLEHQQVPDYQYGGSSLPLTNVGLSMRSVFQWIKDQYRSQNPNLIRKTFKAFAEDSSIDLAAAHAPALDKQQIREWFRDPEFHLLMDQPSVEQILFSHQPDFDFILKSFVESMGFSGVTTQGIMSVRINLQHPGHIFPLHLDRPRHVDYDNVVEHIGQTPSHRRFLIFMDDWQPGQVFQMDHDFIKWQSGDVYTWDVRNTMHGSANFGYEPRWMLMYTLQIND